MEKQKIAVVGGDERALYAARAFLDAGNRVALYGFEEAPAGRCGGYGEMTCEEPYSLPEAVFSARAVLLPVPVMRNGAVNCPFSARPIELNALLQTLAHSSARIFGGAIPKEFVKKDTVDLLLDDRFARSNALPTAEAAIGLSLLHYPSVLEGSRCAVFGAGRIGEILIRKLNALGADVAVYERKKEKRETLQNNGIAAFPFEELNAGVGGYDLVYNTVPFPVVDDGISRRFSKECLYIELASKPGGMTKKARETAACEILDAQGLPGRCSPRYSGDLIARTVLDALNERED